MPDRVLIDLSAPSWTLAEAARLANCAALVQKAQGARKPREAISLCLETEVSFGKFDAEGAGHSLMLLVQGTFEHRSQVQTRIQEQRSVSNQAYLQNQRNIEKFVDRLQEAVSLGELELAEDKIKRVQFFAWAKGKGSDIEKLIPIWTPATDRGSVSRDELRDELDQDANGTDVRALLSSRPQLMQAVTAAVEALIYFKERYPDDDWPTAKSGSNPGRVVEWLMAPPYRLPKSQAELIDRLLRPEDRKKGGNKPSKAKPQSGS